MSTAPKEPRVEASTFNENDLYDALALLSAAADRINEGNSDREHQTLRLIQMASEKVQAVTSELERQGGAA